MTFPTDPTSSPQDSRATAQQPVASEGSQATQPYGAPQAGTPQAGAPAGYAPGYESYAVPAATSTGQGLSIAALILAILIWPVGLILGIVAVVKARPKGLAIAAVIVSAVLGLITAILIAVGVAVTASTHATKSAKPAVAASAATTPPAPAGVDPVCAETGNILITSAQELKANQSDPTAVAKTLNDIVDKLKAQKGMAADPAVISGLDALIADYQELSDDLKNSKAPNGDFLTRMTQDATKLTLACS